MRLCFDPPPSLTLSPKTLTRMSCSHTYLHQTRNMLGNWLVNTLHWLERFSILAPERMSSTFFFSLSLPINGIWFALCLATDLRGIVKLRGKAIRWFYGYYARRGKRQRSSIIVNHRPSLSRLCIRREARSAFVRNWWRRKHCKEYDQKEKGRHEKEDDARHQHRTPPQPSTWACAGMALKLMEVSSMWREAGARPQVTETGEGESKTIRIFAGRRCLDLSK